MELIGRRKGILRVSACVTISRGVGGLEQAHSAVTTNSKGPRKGNNVISRKSTSGEE